MKNPLTQVVDLKFQIHISDVFPLIPTLIERPLIRYQLSKLMETIVLASEINKWTVTCDS